MLKCGFHHIRNIYEHGLTIITVLSHHVGPAFIVIQSELLTDSLARSNSSSVSGQKEWNNLLAAKVREKIEAEPEKYALTPEELGRGVASGEAVGSKSTSGDVPFEIGNVPYDDEEDDEDDDCSTLRGGEAQSGGTMDDVFDWLGEDGECLNSCTLGAR